VHEGRPALDALTGGYRLALLVGAALVVAAIAVAVTVLRPARSRAAQTAPEPEPVLSGC